MRKILTLLLLTFISTYTFAYSIEKNYGGVIFWEYQINATNESIYSENDEGEKDYSHTVLIRDSKSSINYQIDCVSENDALKTYFDYISKYKTLEDIKDKLIPELQKKIISYETSDSGSWMYCKVSESDKSDIPYISDKDFLKLFYEKYDTGIFDKKDFLEAALNLFDNKEEFLECFFGSILEIDSEENFYKTIILWLLEDLETAENKDQLEKIINELTILIDNADNQSEEDKSQNASDN